MKRIEINNETKRVLICCYGTLRQQFHNHYLLEDSKLLGTYTSEPGFTMYTNGNFPILSSKGTDTFEYEVYEILNPEVLEDLHRLEGCSGIPGDPRSWYDIQPLETPNGRAYIYITHEEMDLDVVETGNWNYQKQKATYERS